MISGMDRSGSFEIRRRFNDFYLLREGLLKKFPGIYIPPVPEKKVIVIIYSFREINKRNWLRIEKGSWTTSASKSLSLLSYTTQRHSNSSLEAEEISRRLFYCDLVD